MRRCFCKFLHLSSADRWLTIRSLLALVTARAALGTVRLAHRPMPLDATRKVVDLSQRLLPAPALSAPAERIAWAVKAVSENTPGLGNCLVKAVALESLLKMAHHACALRIGVAKKPSGEFLAHAWIEKDGGVLLGEFEPGSLQPLTARDRTA